MSEKSQGYWLLAFVVAILGGIGLRQAASEAFGPYLTNVTSGGAGVIAGMVISYARPRLEPWVHAFRDAKGWRGFTARAVAYLLFSPRYTRYTVLILTMLIGAGAAVLLSYISGQEVDAALGAGSSFIWSQIYHSLGKEEKPAVLLDITSPQTT